MKEIFNGPSGTKITKVHHHEKLGLNVNRIKKVRTLEQLEALGLPIIGEGISYRGGNLGVNGVALANAINIHYQDVPPCYGVYCNYLGGGIRGAITKSGFNPNLPRYKRKILSELADAVMRVYLDLEKELGLLDTTDPDGETNWENLATQQTRRAGIKSYPGL